MLGLTLAGEFWIARTATPLDDDRPSGPMVEPGGLETSKQVSS